MWCCIALSMASGVMVSRDDHHLLRTYEYERGFQSGGLSLSQVSKGTWCSQHLALCSLRPIWASYLQTMKTVSGHSAWRSVRWLQETQHSC